MANQTSLPRKMRDLIEESDAGEFHLKSNFQPVSVIYEIKIYSEKHHDMEVDFQTSSFHFKYITNLHSLHLNKCPLLNQLHNQRNIIDNSSIIPFFLRVTGKYRNPCMSIYDQSHCLHSIFKCFPVFPMTSCIQSNTTSE